MPTMSQTLLPSPSAKGTSRLTSLRAWTARAFLLCQAPRAKPGSTPRRKPARQRSAVRPRRTAIRTHSTGSESGTATGSAKWVDHIAKQHDVHIVFASGNYDKFVNPDYYVSNVGMAYNAFTVGCFDDKNIVEPSNEGEEHSICDYSAYEEWYNINRAEKPNVIASGENIYLEIVWSAIHCNFSMFSS